jgi:hypothetical protein
MQTKLNHLKDYFTANPGTPFIIAFMALLLSAAALLTTGRPNEADDIANYAFYSLVLGIAIQIGVAVRESRKHPHPNDSRPPGSA